MLKSASPKPLPPRVYTLKKCVALPLEVIRGMCCKVQARIFIFIRRLVVLQSASFSEVYVCLLVLQSVRVKSVQGCNLLL